MGGLGMVELRFNELRDRLDLLGYRQPLGLESLPLVEGLLADLLQTTDSLKAAKQELDDLKKEDAERQVCVEPYRQDNARLCQQVANLQQMTITSREKQEAALKGLKSEVRRLETENEDLRFLGGQYNKRAAAAEERVFKLLEQQSEPAATVSLSGERRPRRQRRQRMDLSDQLSGSEERWRDRLFQSRGAAPPAGSLELVSAAEARISELETQRDLAEDARESAEAAAAELSDKIKSREGEITRLKAQLEGGRPYRAIIADCDDKENEMSRANLPYNELKRANARLEKQLKETVRSQHEAMERAVTLAQQNEALRRELGDLDRIVHVLDEDREQAARSTARQLRHEQAQSAATEEELGAVAARQEALQSQADQQAAQLAAAQERASAAEAGTAAAEAALAAARQGALRLEGELAAARQDVSRLDGLLETMRTDRKTTLEKLDRLTENEKQLVLELDRVSRQQTNKARTPEKTQRLISSLEEQRDHFKRQVEDLLGQLHQKDRRDLEAELSEQLEFYRTEILRLENENHRLQEEARRLTADAGTDGNRLHTEITELQCQLTNRDRQLNDLNRQLTDFNRKLTDRERQLNDLNRQLTDREHQLTDLNRQLTDRDRQLTDRERQLSESAAQVGAKTDESEQLRQRLDEALRSLHRLSESESAATVASTAQLESLLRTVEHERSMACGDYKRVEKERDDLRCRLKAATETQLADRVKLESRIAELEALVGAAETDRTVQHSQVASHRALISSLEAQVKNLQGALSDSQVELTRVMTKNTKMKTFVDRGETNLKDCENQMIKLGGELEAERERTGQLKRQCADLRSTIDGLQREGGRQTQVINQVIAERDKFQNDVDDKTELLDEHRQQLEKCHALIGELETTVKNLTDELSGSREDLSSKSQQLRQLRRQLESAESQQTSSERQRGAVTEENRRLQQDLVTLTNELQSLRKQRQEADQLQEELKQQVRDYVNEVARVEELLGIREEERSDLLRQYKNLSIEASGLEETNHTLGSEVSSLRADLAARDAELSHAHETITLLNEDVQNTSVARQQADISVSRLNEAQTELEVRLQRCEAERERLDRELATCRDLNLQLETQRERTSRQLAERERELERLRSESATRETELEAARQQLSAERATAQRLEQLLSSARGQQCQADTAQQQLSGELAQTADRLAALHSKLEAQKVEAGLYRSQAAECDLEVDRLKRQLVGERFEKERLGQDLRRLRKEAVLSSTAPAAGGASFSVYGTPPGGGGGGSSGGGVGGSRSVAAETSVERRYTSISETSAADYRRFSGGPESGPDPAGS